MTRESAGKGSDEYRVVPGRDEGWDVVIEHDHHVVSSTHCSDWHRVERLRAALDRQRRPEGRAPRSARR